MRAVVLGAAGVLGTPIVRRLRAAGWDVTAVTRSGPTGLGDLAGRAFDLTVHLLAYTPADLDVLGTFAPGRVVIVSTGQVYLTTPGLVPPFREADVTGAVRPEPAPGTRDHGNWTYGVGKLRMEQAAEAWERVRLPIVIGAEDRTGRLGAYVARVEDGGPVLVPGSPDQPLRFVWNEDVARLLVEAPPWTGALNWAQPEVLTVRSFVTTLADVLGRPVPPLVPCTDADLAAEGLDDEVSPLVSRWCSVPDPARAVAHAGFSATPFRDALRALLPRLPRPALPTRDAERRVAARLGGQNP